MTITCYCVIGVTSHSDVTSIRRLMLMLYVIFSLTSQCSSAAAIDSKEPVERGPESMLAVGETLSKPHRHSRSTDQRDRGPAAAAAAGTSTETGTENYYTGSSEHVSRLLDSLLKGYDKRLRPNYNGNPVEVGITMYVSSVSSISEVNMDYTLNFYFRQTWRDPRLSFGSGDDELCISNEMLGRIWWPDTFFANAKMANIHTVPTQNAFLRIKPDGTVLLSQRLTVTATCPMDLAYFPMDTQICSLEIESYAYSAKHIAYKWKDGERKSVGLDRTVQLPQFSIRGYRTKYKLEALSTGNYSQLVCEFYFVRSLGYYLINIYIPSCLIVVMSWISFWLHRDASLARVALGITTVLTMTTILSSSNASLPKISYLKSIDFYLVTCFFMVFASLLEYACVSYLSNLRLLQRKDAEPTVAAAEGGVGCSSSTGAGEPCIVISGSGKRDGSHDPAAATELKCLNTSVSPSSSGNRQQVDSKLQPATGSASVEKVKVDRHVALACAIDRYSRAIFPITFAVFNVVYWSIFLSLSSQPNDFY